MGVKPGKVGTAGVCPASPYFPKPNPAYLFMEISGVVRGDNVPPDYPPAPNGFHALPFIGCSLYSIPWGPFGLNIRFWDGWVTANMVAAGGGGILIASFDFFANSFLLPFNTFYPLVYSGGIVTVEMCYDYTYAPAAWQAAKLVPVPMVEGYFAEQGYCGLSDKNYRYANHANGTNIKLILE